MEMTELPDSSRDPALGEREESDVAARLGKCEVCNAGWSKYTCPRCEVKTCSISCVKIHKDELECSGIRDRTGFKQMNKFSNLDLLSDYRLLEDISKTTLKYRKDITKRYTRFNTALPIQLFKLKRAAYSRGVRLLFLPQNFSKHRENSTYYEWKSKNFYWRIEWIFAVDSGVKKIIDDRVLDSQKLGKAISKYLEPEVQDPEFEQYYSASFHGVILLLKCEKTNDKYYKMDASSSIRANLRNKTIIEHPSVHVVLKHRKDEYELIDSDDEEMCQMRRRRKDEKDQDDVRVIERTSSSPVPVFDIS